MPFRSTAQRAWMYANKPEMAKRWEKESPSKGKHLPKHVPHHLHKKAEGGSMRGIQVNMSGSGDYDTIPSYLNYFKSLQNNNVDGATQTLDHIRQVRGINTANNLAFIGKNLKTSSLNDIARRGKSDDAQINLLYSTIRENPDIINHFQYGTEMPNIIPANLAKFAAGGQTPLQMYQSIFDDEDKKAYINTVKENTAPDEEELEQAQPEVNDDEDNEQQLFQNRMSSTPYNPYKAAKAMFSSSGKYGTRGISPIGEAIASELTNDLGYSPRFNSIYRDPSQQAALVRQGVGVKNSYHLTGSAVDVAPSDWNNLSPDQQKKYRSKYDVISHNNHVHLEPRG